MPKILGHECNENQNKLLTSFENWNQFRFLQTPSSPKLPIFLRKKKRIRHYTELSSLFTHKPTND